MNRIEHPMTEASRVKLLELIKKIHDRKDAAEFRHPVDYEAFGNKLNQ